jgi:hypothetical protein
MVLLCGLEPIHFLTNMTDTAVQASMATSANFTIIALPDTQEYTYASNYNSILYNQTQWIWDNKDTLNIVAVTGEGDIVSYPTDVEYSVADKAYYTLETSYTGHPDGIPYAIPVGNHDQQDSYVNFNNYFGVWRFTGRNYYGGHYSTNNNNHYILFNASGMSFIVISLEYNPSTAVLNWADGLLQTYSNRRAIVVEHCILNVDASWEGNGQTIYNTLKDNPNLFLMLCGHMHGENRRTETYNSHTVNILLADYQTYSNGGNGYLRIMTFCPATNQIKVKTYSPYVNRYETDANSQFNLTYDMNPTGQSVPINKKNTPGFELIIIIGAIALVMFWRRKREIQ